MEHHITYEEFALLLAIFWLPTFFLSAAFHWFMLANRRWRLIWVVLAFLLSIVLAFFILFSPISDLFLFLGSLGTIFAFGGAPLQAGLLSALLTTLVVLCLLRLGLPPNNSFKPTPLRGAA